MTEPTGFADCGRVEFKLAASLADLDAQDAQSVRSDAASC
jgi:hypothetical protein